jgi:hypothetical protein
MSIEPRKEDKEGDTDDRAGELVIVSQYVLIFFFFSLDNLPRSPDERGLEKNVMLDGDALE